MAMCNIGRGNTARRRITAAGALTSERRGLSMLVEMSVSWHENQFHARAAAGLNELARVAA